MAWAFCFAGSGLFFPLVLGIWWKRANRTGAIWGMLSGFIAGSFYLYLVRFAGMEPLWAIDHLRFSMIGMPISLVVMVIVSLMTEEPDEEMRALVDETRDPTGRAILAAE